MTDTTRRLIAELERLPDDEQDEAAASLLERLQQQKETSSPDDDETLYEPFRVMMEADLDLPPDYSETYEEHLYGELAGD